MSNYMLAFIQGSEWLIIGLAVLLLFGAKKLPELARGLGKGIREFKKAQLEEDEELGHDAAVAPPVAGTSDEEAPNSSPPGA